MEAQVTQRLHYSVLNHRSCLDCCRSFYCLAVREVNIMNDSDFVRNDLHDKDIDILIQENNNLNNRIDDMKAFVSWGFSILGVLLVVVQLGVGFILYLITKTPAP